jgi:iron(III) transport system permease protein
MTLVLYPYVYLLARAAFLEQSVCALEVARTLGLGPVRSFLKVALPLARPAIVVGVSLVLMETLNDFGTVDFFAVPTLTIGIYDVWLNMNSTAAAAQLCLVLLAFVFGLICLERLARRRRRFHHTSARYRVLPTHDLRGGWAWLASVGCAAPVAFGFALPAALLLGHSLENPLATVMGELLVYGFNSLMLAGTSALLAVIIALCLAYGARIRGGATVPVAVRIAGVGYAIPGAVLAVGLLAPLAAFDNAVDGLIRQLFGISTGLLFSGTLAALVFAYVVRFLALSLGTVEAGLAKITPHMDGVARTLGRGPARTLWSVHMPMMRGSVLTAALLVFVDSMKELPITVLLRPFNFDTLATHVHQMASLEQLEQSAPGALAIVGAGILPVIAISRTIRHSRPGDTQSRP